MSENELLAHIYKIAYIKLIDVPAKVALNSRKADYVTVTHIIRSLIVQNIDGITLSRIGQIEHLAGRKNITDHTTVINSIKVFIDESKNKYKITFIKKLINDIYYKKTTICTTEKSCERTTERDYKKSGQLCSTSLFRYRRKSIRPIPYTS